MSNLTAWERWELGSLDVPVESSPPLPPAEGVMTVKPPTVAEIELIREQARQEGHAEGRQTGHAEGREAGYAEGRQMARGEAEKLAAATARLDEMLKELEGQVANELLALAVEIARQVLRGELTARPETLLDVVREALMQLPHQHASIFLNPEDASLLRSYLGDQLGHAGHRIHDDPRLGRGDCLIEAGASQVDATVATRWRRVVEGLGIGTAWATPDEKGEDK